MNLANNFLFEKNYILENFLVTNMRSRKKMLCWWPINLSLTPFRNQSKANNMANNMYLHEKCVK